MNMLGERQEGLNWRWLWPILALGVLVRLVFWVGFMGSDEATYLKAAKLVLAGEWPTSNYIGVLRYGVNLPMAGAMALGGVSEGAAVFWGLACSVLEVAVVFVLGYQLAGTRVGLLAAVFLAVLPAHVHYASRIMADPPLALLVSLGMSLMITAEDRSARWAYMLSGVAFGTAYWVKESGLYVSLTALVLYALLVRRFHWRWLWLVVGLSLMVAGNMLLMWLVYDDPLYIQRSIQLSLGRIEESTNKFFYLKALFVDIRNIGLIGWVALAGVVVLALRRGPELRSRTAARVMVFWWLGFVTILSQLPLRQINYMLLFAAPMAVLGSYALIAALAQMRRLGYGLVALVLSVGLMLAALQQAAVHAFTANSRLAVAIADANPGFPMFGPTGAVRADDYASLLEQPRASRAPIRGLVELDLALAEGQLKSALVLRDLGTEGWNYSVDRNWTHRLLCLDPIPWPAGINRASPSVGERVAAHLLVASAYAPAPVARVFKSTVKSGDLQLFRVIPGCRSVPTAASK